MLTSFILTKEISNQLLETYLNEEYRPFVNSLNDLANNEHIQVIDNDVSNIMQHVATPDILEKLEGRFNNDERTRSKEDFGLDDLKNILDGTLVMVDDSESNWKKTLLYPDLALTCGNTRYGLSLQTFFINKNATESIKILKL